MVKDKDSSKGNSFFFLSSVFNRNQHFQEIFPKKLSGNLEWNLLFFDSNSLSKLHDFYKMWQIKIYFKFGEGSVAIESISSEICCRSTIEHAWCTCYIRWKKHSSVAHIEHNFCWLTFQSTVLHLRLSPRRLLFSSFLIPVNVEQWKQ